MGCVFVCDGCGKNESAREIEQDYHKPRDWLQREDEDGLQDACSRECIEVIAKATDKTAAVIPL